MLHWIGGLRFSSRLSGSNLSTPAIEFAPILIKDPDGLADHTFPTRATPCSDVAEHATRLSRKEWLCSAMRGRSSGEPAAGLSHVNAGRFAQQLTSQGLCP